MSRLLRALPSGPLLLLVLLGLAALASAQYVVSEKSRTPPPGYRPPSVAEANRHFVEAKKKAWCGSKHADHATTAAVEAATKLWKRLMPRAATLPASFTVPVYIWNVWVTGTYEGYLTREQCEAQIAVLNLGFAGKLGGANGTYTDDGTPFGSIPIQFVLAEANDVEVDRRSLFNFDPESAAEDNLRAKYRRGGCDTLNVYTHGQGNSHDLGVAQYPWDCADNMATDGVFVRYTTFPGISDNSYNLGRTLVHETGHWVGLRHTFEGGCTTTNDYVADTPQEADATYECPSSANTCAAPGKDPIRNLMDYGDDKCIYKFTPLQGARAYDQFALYRWNNKSSSPPPLTKRPPPTRRSPPPPVPKRPPPPGNKKSPPPKGFPPPPGNCKWVCT